MHPCRQQGGRAGPRQRDTSGFVHRGLGLGADIVFFTPSLELQLLFLLALLGMLLAFPASTPPLSQVAKLSCRLLGHFKKNAPAKGTGAIRTPCSPAWNRGGRGVNCQDADPFGAQALRGDPCKQPVGWERGLQRQWRFTGGWYMPEQARQGLFPLVHMHQHSHGAPGKGKRMAGEWGWESPINSSNGKR